MTTDTFADLVAKGATDTEKKRHLAEGGQIAITLRIPKNLKEAAQEQASLKGMSFSAYMRTCLIDDLTGDE